MNKSNTFLASALAASALFVATSLFFGCASTQAAPSTTYAVTVSQADGAEVSVQPKRSRSGFESFQVTVNNTSDSDLQVLWAKSVVQAGDRTNRVFLEGQDVATTEMGATPTVIGAHKQIVQTVYSVWQVSLQTTQTYTANGTTSDDTDDLDNSARINFEPIKDDNVTITIALKNGDKEQTVTATIAPADSAAPAAAQPEAAPAPTATAAEEPAPAEADATEASEAAPAASADDEAGAGESAESAESAEPAAEADGATEAEPAADAE